MIRWVQLIAVSVSTMLFAMAFSGCLEDGAENNGCETVMDCSFGFLCFDQQCLTHDEACATCDMHCLPDASCVDPCVDVECGMSGYGVDCGGCDDEDSYCVENTCKSVSISWVDIDGGSFTRGCLVDDDDICYYDENPTQDVTVPDFKMMTHEVTQAQFEAVMGSTPSRFGDCPTCAVDNVTWFEAQDFCSYIGGYLPSEAQFEWAARAGSETLYCCGDDGTCMDDLAWYSANSDSSIHPVGQKQANANGLYDIFGNVWEWCGDCYFNSYDYYPDDGSERVYDGCAIRSLRGGSWRSNLDSLRSAKRSRNAPSNRWYFNGFRCVADPD